MRALRTFPRCAAAIAALVLTCSQAAADFATPFVETTPVGGTSKEYGYLVSTGAEGTHFLVIVMTDQLQYHVLRGVADKGVVEDSVLGKRALIQARVLKKQRDKDKGRVNVELKITRVWPDAERPNKGAEGKTAGTEEMLPKADLKKDSLKMGPVIERTICDPHGPGSHCLIDFDTGRVLAWPVDGLPLLDLERRYTDGFKNFMATNGLDAVAWAKSGEEDNGLVGFGMTVLPVKNDRWDMDPRRLAGQLAGVKPREQQTIRGVEVRPGLGKTPATTYVFQTREGSTGVLQITLATPSIKVRYKLLRKIPGDAKEIDTPEIVRILEEEPIASFSNSHSQDIHIILKDGRTYLGTYDQEKAGKYATDPHLFNILNLTKHIFATRAMSPKDAALAEIKMLGGRVKLDEAGSVIRVDLRDTKVTDAGLEHLRALPTLRTLYFGVCTQITDVGLEHLSELPHLDMLELHGTKTTDAGLEHLKGLPNLKHLVLSKQVTGAGLECPKGLTGLRVLTLANTQITDAQLKHVEALTGLESLDLSSTPITDAGLKHLEVLTNLEKLRLNGTKVTDAGLVHVKGLTGLRMLQLSGTQVTDAGLAWIPTGGN